MTDTDLLGRYVAQRSDELFTQLVRQHIDLVYSAARRQVRDPALAADVTQAVFLLLSQRAAKVRGSLAGWLIFTTGLTARNAKKMQARRIKHERRAAEMKSATSLSDEPTEWAAYAPLLDSALASLREPERNVLVARYLQGKPLREVGEMIGVSEEAARKRVDRALQQLRKILNAKTPMPAIAVLGSHLDRFAVQPAPRELVESFVRHVAAAKGGTAAAIAHQVRLASLVVKAKVAAIALLVLLATGAAIAKLMTADSVAPQAAALAPTISAPAHLAPQPVSTVDPIEANRPGIGSPQARWPVSSVS